MQSRAILLALMPLPYTILAISSASASKTLDQLDADLTKGAREVRALAALANRRDTRRDLSSNLWPGERGIYRARDRREIRTVPR